MYIKCLLFILPLVAANPFNQYRCGLGPGEEICQNDRCSPLVVRPVEIPRPILQEPKVVCHPVGGVKPLTPVGGPCSCYTSLVKPAVVPKPLCSSCSSRVDVSQNHYLTLGQQQQLLFGGSGRSEIAQSPIGDSVRNYENPAGDSVRNYENPAGTFVADPVSLSVALKAAQEACHYQEEEKLAYGFRSIPKDIALNKHKGLGIDEQDLLRLNAPVVELKKVKCGNVKSLDEEAAEELLALEEESEVIGADAVGQVSFAQIGYGPARIHSARYIDVPVANPPPPPSPGDIRVCKDGFRPGQVIIEQIPKFEPVSLPHPLPEPCDHEEHHCFPPGPVVLPCGHRPYSYVSSSSSSSAASSNQYSQSSFLHKIGAKSP